MNINERNSLWITAELLQSSSSRYLKIQTYHERTSRIEYYQPRIPIRIVWRREERPPWYRRRYFHYLQSGYMPFYGTYCGEDERRYPLERRIGDGEKTKEREKQKLVSIKEERRRRRRRKGLISTMIRELTCFSLFISNNGSCSFPLAHSFFLFRFSDIAVGIIIRDDIVIIIILIAKIIVVVVDVILNHIQSMWKKNRASIKWSTPS